MFQWFQRAAFVGGGAGGAPSVPANQLVAPAVLSRPLATFPISTANLYLALNATDTMKYAGGVAPADGANVAALMASRGLGTHAVQQGSQQLPSYAANVLSSGRPGLIFDSANSEGLSLAGALSNTVSTDYAVTMVAVFRTAATPASEQTILHHARDAAVSNHRETVRLSITATSFIFRAQNGSGTDTINGSVSIVPAAGQTYIAVGRHGPSGDDLNTISVRASGSTTTGTAGAGNTLNFTSAAAHDRFTLGFRGMFAGFGQPFNGGLFAAYAFNRKISDSETTTLIDALRAEYGVA
jgi:hypothetical protein